MLQPQNNLLLRSLRIRPPSANDPNANALSPGAVEERERGPCGVELESLEIFDREFHEWARMQIRLESSGFSTFVIG